MQKFLTIVGMVAALAAVSATVAQTPPAPVRKHVLAWADVRQGYQHDSITHAMATIERLGRESGLYDTWIRTDSGVPKVLTCSIGA